MFTYHKSYKNRWVSGYNYACIEPQNLLLYFVKMRVINEKESQMMQVFYLVYKTYILVSCWLI